MLTCLTASERFWLHRRDRYYAMTQMCNFVVETRRPLLERSLRLSLPACTVIRRPHKDSDHSCDRCRSLTLTCQNSPCWRSCERCNNFLSSLWLPLLIWSTDWWQCVLVGTCLNYQRVATNCNGYQECSCPSFMKEVVLLPGNISPPVSQ